jgi:hypothetical protein
MHRPVPVEKATDEEAAAILAAMEALWPKPVAAVDPPAQSTSPWRFSGRWWAGPTPISRARPRRW